MATFVFAYRAPEGYVPGTPETRVAWTAWFETMGAQLVDIGKPVFESASLGSSGAGTRLGGYSIITADDLESAVRLAKGCPHLQRGGGVDIGQLVDLP